MNKKIIYYIWLSSTLHAGSKTPKILLEHFGSIEKVFEADKESLKDLSLASGDIQALCNKNLDNAKKYYEYCEKNKIGILCYEDPYYPERLKIIDNPPPMFYYKGRLLHLDDFPCFTMVGTRSCSERGFRLAYESGYDAASKGAVIVNGLALGIDGACIAGALDANGYAIGLLGCGIDRIYPYGNKDLFERLSATGLILTEFPPFSEPKGTNFPVRNRVMSALSLATVVFEADASSGAMITAKHALEQGRRIFAVPGKPYDKTYSGPLELIKDGATVFTEADDILTEYSMSFPHRINLANKNTFSQDKLNAYVAKYFKKDTDPDAPVNRRHVPKNTNENSYTSHKEAPKPVKPAAVQKTAAVEMPKIIREKTSAEAENAEQASVQRRRPSSDDLLLLTPVELQTYNVVLKNGIMTPDEISGHGIKIDEILAALTLLEIYDLVIPHPGGKYEAVPTVD